MASKIAHNGTAVKAETQEEHYVEVYLARKTEACPDGPVAQLQYLQRLVQRQCGDRTTFHHLALVRPESLRGQLLVSRDCCSRTELGDDASINSDGCVVLSRIILRWANWLYGHVEGRRLEGAPLRQLDENKTSHGQGRLDSARM
jgi:hypothetical protein